MALERVEDDDGGALVSVEIAQGSGGIERINGMGTEEIWFGMEKRVNDNDSWERVLEGLGR